MSGKRKKKLKITDKNLKSVRDLLSQNKFEEAEKEAREVIKLDPENVDAHYILSAALFYQDKEVDAEKEAREVIRLDPENANAHYILSRALFSQDKEVEAEKEVREAIKLDPEICEAHEVLSRLFFSKDNLEEAEREAREATKYCTGAIHRINLSKILMSQHKLEEAEKEAREVIRLDPENSDAHYILSRALFSQDKEVEAEKEAREAIRLDPEDSEAYNTLSKILFVKKSYEEAEKEARKATKINPKNPEAHQFLANALAYQEKFEDAEKEAKEAIQLDPKYSPFYTTYTRILALQDKFEEAEKEAREAIKLDHEYAEAHDILARSLQGQRKFAEAELEAKEAIRYCPGVNHREALISILLDLNNFDKAETEAREVVKSYADESTSHLILSEVLFTTGKIEEADKELLEAIKIGDEKDKCEIFLDIGTLLLSNGKFEIAILKIDEAIKCYNAQADTKNAVKATGFKKWAMASEKWREGDVKQSIALYSEANKLFGSINNKLAEYMNAMSQFCSIDSEIQGIIDLTDQLIIKDRVPYFLKKAEGIVIKIKKEPERSLVEARIIYYRVILQFLQEISNIDETANIDEKESIFEKFVKSLESAYFVFKKHNSTVGMAGYHSFMLQFINAKELFRKLKNEDPSKYYQETQNWLNLHFPRIKETLSFYDETLSNEIDQYIMGKSREPKISKHNESKHLFLTMPLHPEIRKRALVFGPRENSEDYSLRVDIRKVLEALKFEVLFPEDFRREIDLKNWLAENKINLTYEQEMALSNLTGRELILAENCDMLIILLIKPGAISEFSQFYTDPRVASKIRVLIPTELYKSESYVRAGPLQMFEERFKHVYQFENTDQAKNIILQISRSDVAYDYLKHR